MHLPTLNPEASERVVIMPLAVETVAAEEVGVSMIEVMSKDVEEEVDKLEEDTPKEVMGEAAKHIKIELIS